MEGPLGVSFYDKLLAGFLVVIGCILVWILLATLPR